jgi:hypothetical protein
MPGVLDAILKTLAVTFAVTACFVFLADRRFLLILGYPWVEVVTGEPQPER